MAHYLIERPDDKTETELLQALAHLSRTQLSLTTKPVIGIIEVVRSGRNHVIPIPGARRT